MKWTTPKHPGDSVRITRFKRGDEVGDVRIQWYGETSVKVGSFLPGEVQDLPGDTPKVWPERSQYHRTRDAADSHFEVYVKEALREGWTLVGEEPGNVLFQALRTDDLDAALKLVADALGITDHAVAASMFSSDDCREWKDAARGSRSGMLSAWIRAESLDAALDVPLRDQAVAIPPALTGGGDDR